MQAVSSGGTTTLSREDNGVAVLSSNTTPYLFINNSTSSSTSVCPAYVTPFACTTINNLGLTPTSPFGIAVDPPSKNVYVISRGNTSNSLSCSINSTNGGLNCSTLSFAADLESKGCTAAQGIAIDPPGQNAYITCGNSKVYKCALSGSTCNQLTLSGTPTPLNNPMGIVIDPMNTYMAIANNVVTGFVTTCKIDGTGCVTGNSGNSVAYMTVNNKGNYLYTGKSNGSSVYSCPVTLVAESISIGSCSIKSSSAANVKGIAVNPSGANVYIAVQNSGGLISSCPANPGSEISANCSNTSSTGLSSSMQGATWGNVVESP
mgnify:CR=1 FL=1